MRGKEFRMLYAYGNSRITPAYAGKSVIFIEFEEFRRDHPRLCGEKCSIVEITCCNAGITPAYAGKSKDKSGE